jgi:predicted lipoprotein with Yx(FWY)xxD motif
LSNWGTIFTAENLVVTFEGVASIPVSAFYNCTNLTNVTIGNSVTDIRYGAFPGCTSLTAFNVDAGNSVYSSQDGVLYNKDKTTLIQYPAGKTDASFTIPNSVTSIDGSAFSLCASLTAFNVDAGNSVYSSQDGVLYNKDKTTLIQYPAGKTDVSFTIPNSVTDIGSGAFQYCTNLASVTIPNGVTSIGNGAFARCSGLTSVTFNGTIASDKFLGGNSFFSTFDGDLRAKFYETDSTNGTPGTYTTTAPVSRDSEWSKQ